MGDDVRIKDLVLRWEELRERGEEVSVEALCADAPELLDEVRQQIRSLRAMNALLAEAEGESIAATGDIPATCPATEPLTPLGKGHLPGVVDVSARYQELRFHDRGGLGEVYIGVQADLRRHVALKLLREDLGTDRESRDRFVVEAEITSQLDHPGVVPVHGVGTTQDGRPFYVMRLIQGGNLKKAIDQFHRQHGGALRKSEAAMELRKLLSSFVSVCNTIAYAHNRGIVHLDIKPENIMLGKYGETLVVDWGLAIPVSRDARARASGELTLRPTTGSNSSSSSGKGMGTPAYMSPEQIPGSSEPLGPECDVYGLGATLYKLLTGKAPVEGKTVEEIWDRIREGDITAPRKVNSQVSAALEAVCLKAMARRSSQRYATPLELAAEIDRWLADQAVTAYRGSALERLGRWTRHHRTSTLAAAVGLIVLLLASTGAALLMGRLAEKEKTARRSEAAARQVAEKARQDGIQVAARFAGRTVANEIDLRWRILEGEVGDAELRRLLEKIEAGPPEAEDQKSLQAWLDAQYAEHLAATKASSWLLNDATGKQWARSPYSDRTVGRNYAFRDYFHGRGRDLGGEEGKDDDAPGPIREPHLSRAFQSQADASYRVAFTVPVWSGRPGTPDRRVLGVLGMTVEVGHFAALRLGLGSRQIAVLVDTREDWLEGEPRIGLILHHPRLEEARFQRGDPHARVSFRVDSEQARHLRDLRPLRLLLERRAEAGAENSPLTQRLARDSLELHYRDPLDPDADRRWLAAFEPVLVTGRPDQTRDTGLVVIVQESGGPGATAAEE